MTTETKKPRKQSDVGTQANALVSALIVGGVDGRTSLAKNYIAARGIVDASHEQMTTCLLKDLLSAYSIAQAKVLSELVRSDTLLDGGELSPAFAQLQQIEQSVIRISKHLQSIDEQQAKATKSPRSGGKVRAKGDDTTIDIATLFSDDEVQP